MTFARTVILGLSISLAWTPARAIEPGAGWQGPAAAAAEAAAAKATVVPPAPKPADRPVAAKEAPQPDPKPEPPASAAEAKDAKKPENKKPEKKPALSARQLFGTVTSGAPLKARAVGWYAKGCLAGGKALEVNGPGWQVMRLSRNRNWAHPDLVALIERLARETTAAKEWPGLLVGDMSQPRGGPMTSGHKSHQVGLDADIWLTPMPDRVLTRREREDMSAVSMLRNAGEVDPKVWGDGQVKLIKRAASYPAVERILIHPALKKALCEAAGTDRGWLAKVRPFYSHYYHFHIRIGCPRGSTNCRSQVAVPGGDGCDAELKDWLKRVAPKPQAKPKPLESARPSRPSKPAPEMTLADLPPDCSTVLTAGGHVPPSKPAEVIDNSKNAAPVNDLTVVTAAPEPPKKDAAADKPAADKK
jgi:penicillin-insensitive murein endopeptidase